jgi:Uncharacterized integral membrane protein
MATLFIALLFALVIALFALQNIATVTVRFLLWEYEASLVFVVLGAASLGAAFAFVASLGPRLRQTREMRRLAATVHSQAERIRSLDSNAREEHVSSTQGS